MYTIKTSKKKTCTKGRGAKVTLFETKTKGVKGTQLKKELQV